MKVRPFPFCHRLLHKRCDELKAELRLQPTTRTRRQRAVSIQENFCKRNYSNSACNFRISATTEMNSPYFTHIIHTVWKPPQNVSCFNFLERNEQFWLFIKYFEFWRENSNKVSFENSRLCWQCKVRLFGMIFKHCVTS